jgi:hypothetical protein
VDCTIEDALIVDNANLTLTGVNGGKIVAANSNLTLINSDVASLVLTNSTLKLSSASFGTITPAVPTVQIVSPTSGGTYSGDLNITAKILGNEITSVAFKLNGQLLKTYTANGTLSFTLPSQTYTDGNYVLEVNVTQTSGLSTYQNSSFSLNNGQIALQSQVNNLAQSMNILSASQTTWSNQQGALANSLNSLTSKQTQMQNQIQNLTDILSKLGETQQNTTEQMSALTNSLNSTVQQMNGQIMDLQNSIQTAQQLATAGILIGVLGVIVALAVFLNKRLRKKDS